VGKKNFLQSALGKKQRGEDKDTNAAIGRNSTGGYLSGVESTKQYQGGRSAEKKTGGKKETAIKSRKVRTSPKREIHSGSERIERRRGGRENEDRRGRVPKESHPIKKG